jgi:plasmid stabilization system protein ParE
MKRLVFSSVFEGDFAEITAHLALEASPKVSVQWEAEVIRLVEWLQKFPEMGRLRSDLQPPDTRTFRVKEFPNYVVFYRLTADEVVFLRVRHGGMDLTSLFSNC